MTTSRTCLPFVIFFVCGFSIGCSKPKEPEPRMVGAWKFAQFDHAPRQTGPRRGASIKAIALATTQWHMTLNQISFNADCTYDSISVLFDAKRRGRWHVTTSDDDQATIRFHNGKDWQTIRVEFEDEQIVLTDTECSYVRARFQKIDRMLTSAERKAQTLGRNTSE